MLQSCYILIFHENFFIQYMMMISSTYMCVCQSLSCVRLFMTPWTITGQAPLMGFSRQE